MPSQIQLNVKVAKSTATFMRKDAKRYNRTLDGMADRILRFFLTTKSPEEREAFYRTVAPKRLGKKISL